MSNDRIFKSADFLQPSDGEPIRSVITQSADAAIVSWYVKPGQRITAHVHPHGQDTWTVLSGHGEYQLQTDGTSRTISAGDVVVAPRSCVHGVYNSGNAPLIFVSVVCPADSGYELA
jgi:quercetin dioxygenase-like cupin family protein